MTTFFKGQKVVCIDDSPTNMLGLVEIRRGNVYTVRAVTPPDELISVAFGRPLDEHGLLLEEVLRPVDDAELGEMPFGCFRSRPLDDAAQGVERITEAAI